jgi:isoleucyl-tRNA synthetase
LDYAAFDLGEEVLIVAQALADTVFKDQERTPVREMKGSDLLGWRYAPLFQFAEPEGGPAHIVIEADFVSTESGTGIVHLAPGFGEDDARICREQSIGFLQLVEPNGEMSPECGPFAGVYIKDADKGITRDLDQRGLLFERARYTHEYPFCWRAAEDPLIQYARKSWFVRTTDVKDRMIELNSTIGWHPESIQEGRFGDFLRNNVDWALSRERFWGTPLPIWQNDETGTIECVGSVADLLERNPDAFAAFDKAKEADPTLSEHLRVHKPWIDDITWTREGEPGVYRRASEVIDCWFDSGSMPFAQWHYPFENEERFKAAFPADYICEGLDQTRGWFYTMLAIGTLVFDEAPYKNVIVNGLVNDKNGKKMSKSLGNTVDPWEAIDAHGADPLRWYLLAGSPPWLPKAFDSRAVGDLSRRIFGTLWPSYNFFALYADVDSWEPGSDAPAADDRSAMDRWLLSRTHSLVRDYRAALDDYHPMRATRLLGDFIVDELSNWYIRRNRARFWKSQDKADKAAAYHTLYTALDVIAHLLAPIAPFSADGLYLALRPDSGEAESVHLSDLPVADESMIDEELERRMAAILQVVKLGRAAREGAGLKIRQPLARLIATGPDKEALSGLTEAELGEQVKDELNVKQLVIADKSGEYSTVIVKPNLPVLGPRHGKNLGQIKKGLQSLDDAALAAFETDGQVQLDVAGEKLSLSGDDLLVEYQGREGFAVSAEGGYLAALDSTLTPELVQEGLAREVINRIQNQRKQEGLEVTTRIRLFVAGDPEVMSAVETHRDRISAEVLATGTEIAADRDALPNGARDWKVGESEVFVSLQPVD